MSEIKKGYFTAKKREIDRHIADIRLNFNVLTRINQSLRAEKRRPRNNVGFYAKDIKGKKTEILAMLKDEEDFLESFREKKCSGEKAPVLPEYTDDFEALQIMPLLLKPMIQKRTGTLLIKSLLATGEVRYKKGKIWFARFGESLGERAFFETAGVADGSVEFFANMLTPAPENISKETSDFLKNALEQHVI